MVWMKSDPDKAGYKMIDIKISTKNNIDELMSIHLEMLKVVNNLPEDYEYSDEIEEVRDIALNRNISVL